jgi:hypothetical protein
MCPHQHCNNKKAFKGNRMALNNGRKPQCTTAVNWLFNAHDEHCAMQYFPEIQVFVCCLWSGFFCTAVQFFCEKKIETDWLFLIHLSRHWSWPFVGLIASKYWENFYIFKTEIERKTLMCEHRSEPVHVKWSVPLYLE